ncbi:MAG: uridylate kinase [Olpidium bornovanus]|uniref:Uridylate kinase n=1 Tax=Olpidium bornovanus TaxID=278681 RepID=A0A8H7ZPX3_9FUNG|nr:MAG: uridylate kinase [Olpidium bornovanus]
MIETCLKEGKIVPMEVTIALLQNAMKASGSHRFLIDGFPRAMDQAMKFEEQVCPSRAVLYFECPEDVMLKRLLKRGESSGRADDNVETIRKRFKTFNEVSMPVINYYAANDKIIIVSCLNNPEKVYEETKRAIAQIV